MSVKVFRWILVITNLLLILIPISALVLSYFILIPKVFSDEFDRDVTAMAGAFAFWAIILPLTSVCFLGIAFTNSCCLHLLAALLLLIPLAFGSWIVVEQFLFKEQPNWVIVGISFSAAVIWGIQVLTELILSCIFCCCPSSGSPPGDDFESAFADLESTFAKCAESERKALAEGLAALEEGLEDGTEARAAFAEAIAESQAKRFAVLAEHTATACIAKKIGVEVDEGDDDDDDEEEEEEEEEDEEEEPDSQARDHLNDRGHQTQTTLTITFQ